MLKRKTFTVFLIILTVILFSIQLISAETLPLMGVVITVDAGHGGRDSGTLYKDLLEKDINLEIAKELEKELGKNGAITYMTRDSDIDLSSIYDSRKKRGDLYRRLQLIRKNNSDLYLSIHINWYQKSYHKGAEVLYNPINKENKLLATSIMEEFKTDLNSKRDIKQTDLYMYRNTTTPGVLIECGYLSNPTERNLLTEKSYQKKISQSITKGVIKYLKTLNKQKYML